MKEPLKGVNTQMADPNEEPTVPQPQQQYCWLGITKMMV